MKMMDNIGLTELYPAPKAVPFGAGTIEVTGLSMRKVSALMHQYPDLVSIFSGGAVGLSNLLTQAPDAALAVFALVVSDETRIQEFDNLAFGQQADILAAIYELTVGGERAGPFLADVVARLRVVDEPQIRPAPSLNNSQSSPSSSQPADTAEMSAT
jgi:hypothetical protein